MLPPDSGEGGDEHASVLLLPAESVPIRTRCPLCHLKTEGIMPLWPTRLEQLFPARTTDPASSAPRQPAAPAIVYLLAENLDAALAAGEDLLKESFVWNGASLGTPAEIAAARAEERHSIETVRTLEMVLVARVLKSRERAEELARRDERFRPVAKLYNAGTALFIESAAEFADRTTVDFETGNATTAFLRSRGLIAPDQPGPAEGARVMLSEDFLIARRARLGTIMDLVAMFLDTLETHYELFDTEDPEEELLNDEYSHEAGPEEH
jgi:hypothetical protein